MRIGPGKKLLADKIETAAVLLKHCANEVESEDFAAVVEDLWRAQQTIESATRTAVELMREQGATWEAVGNAYRVTKQAAQQRWS